jgi:thiol-disulfide isomerase/thioredoxin
MKQRETKQFQELPVNLEMATPEVLKTLRTNPTGKFLMVNFWATWCGPCVEEFHDLLTTYLWYRSRNFQLVTVSANAPDEKADVLEFLQDQHSAVRNLIFSSDDTYAMQAAFDPKWDSGVPFTIVLAPDGSVIYREAGEVHLLDLRRAILAHLPEMGYPGTNAYWASK